MITKKQWGSRFFTGRNSAGLVSANPAEGAALDIQWVGGIDKVAPIGYRDEEVMQEVWKAWQGRDWKVDAAPFNEWAEELLKKEKIFELDGGQARLEKAGVFYSKVLFTSGRLADRSIWVQNDLIHPAAPMAPPAEPKPGFLSRQDGAVPVFSDLEAAHDLFRAFVYKHAEPMKVLDNKMFFATDGTKIEISGKQASGESLIGITMKEGPHAGKMGWVLQDWVKLEDGSRYGNKA